MKKLARIYKALGDEIRLDIVEILRGRELCVCDIIEAFKLSQPAISHHLKILRQADIVIDRREGKWIYYSLNPDAFFMIEEYISSIKKEVNEKNRLRTCE